MFIIDLIPDHKIFMLDLCLCSKVEVIILYFAGSELINYSISEFFVKIFPIFSVLLLFNL